MNRPTYQIETVDSIITNDLDLCRQNYRHFYVALLHNINFQKKTLRYKKNTILNIFGTFQCSLFLKITTLVTRLKMLLYTFLYENIMFTNKYVRSSIIVKWKCLRNGVGKEKRVALIKSLIDS